MEEKLYGVVQKVTYYNDENGYGIVRIMLDYKDKKIAKYKAKLFTNLLTVTCNFDRKPLVDEEFDFIGEFITNNYGLQFKAQSFNRRNENSLEGIISYLSSELFPGVGPKAAKKVYDTLGKDCLQAIIQDKENIKKVPDISEKQKDIIYDVLVQDSKNKNATISLVDMGLTMPMARKIISILGYDADIKVRSNPYKLIDYIDNFGFLKADKIALNIGIEENSILRLSALVIYVIQNVVYSSGDCFINSQDLFVRLINYLNIDKDVVTKEKYDEVIHTLRNDRRIIKDSNDDIYLSYIAFSEDYLAMKIKEFLSYEKKKADKNKLEYIIKTLEKNLEITYTEKQQEAIKKALEEQILIITGGPGTGKSTIIKGIIEGLVLLNESDNYREKLVLTSPTGRASKRLFEVTGHKAMTIHKLLGYKGHGVYEYSTDVHIPYKIIIIDEMSMVDVELASRLFGALDSDCKVIMIGDKDQLPSVGPGDCLNDMILSKEITVVTLDKILRQASDSSIITLAHKVNQGIIPDNIFEKQQDRNFIKMNDSQIINSIKTVVHGAINKGMDLVKDIQILVPLYKGEIGINSINQSMQEEFNPKTSEEISHFGRFFRPNDKVIQLVNKSEKGVMNGDIGYVYNLLYDGDKKTGLSVMFDFGIVNYSIEELEDLNHAFAISIHKAQGSEFDLAIVPFSFKYYIMLKRKLIYTAITRSKRYLIMLGNIDAMARGVMEIEQRRKTKLCEKIKSSFDNNEKEKLEDGIDITYLEKISPYDFL